MRTNCFFGTMRLGRATSFAFGAATICVLVLLFGSQGAKPAHAATTFTVNSTGDAPDEDRGDGSCRIAGQSGECTLRAAIEESNAFAGADTINFAIPGAGPHTISPLFELPKILKRVTIDGYSESLGEANPARPNAAPTGTDAVLKIEINGAPSAANPPGLENGLYLQGPDASNSVIRGLVINDFRGVGIVLADGTGYKVEGNFIGTDPSGTNGSGTSGSPGLEGPGVSVFGATNSTIGGTSPDKRNLISGNGRAGVSIGSSSSGNRVEGNLIGTKANGTEALTTLSNSQRYGVSVGGSSNTIGGVDTDPTDPNNPANTIAFNRENGVLIVDSTGNRILSNSIFSNGSDPTHLGINLIAREPWIEDANGVTINDPKDPDGSSNRLQNYPELDAPILPNSNTISGKLNSTPSTREKKRTFIIQFFSSPDKDPSGYGEGKTFLGQIQVRTNRQGDATFAFFTQPLSAGQFITATATNKRTGDTSEFSLAREVREPVIGTST